MGRDWGQRAGKNAASSLASGYKIAGDGKYMQVPHVAVWWDVHSPYVEYDNAQYWSASQILLI
eukprot:15292-Eustigmatos_ZCMA.PRE.1